MSRSCFTEVELMYNEEKGTDLEIRKFQKHIEEKHHIKFIDYWDFHKWTVDNYVAFWEAVWDFFGVISSKKYDEIIDPHLPIHETSGWFKGARLNFGENLLKYRDDTVAIITAGEDKEIGRMTYLQLYEEAELYNAAFRKSGLKKGDIVACCMSNRKEAVVAMIAVVSIGAIWTGILPFIGAKGICNKLQLVEAKYLITVDRFLCEGKEIEMLPKMKVVAETLYTLKNIIIVPSREKSNLPDISHIKNSCFLHDFLNSGHEKDGSVPPIHFEQVPASHPVFISFTSGTTGLTKAIVHGFGALMCAAITLGIHFNSNRHSICLSESPAGWASWNIFSSLHFLGLTVVNFESRPHYLKPPFFWNLLEDLKITHVHLLPVVLDEFQKQRYVPTERHKLAALKHFTSGGAVVKPQNYDFVYGILGKDVRFCSAYGTTETMGHTLVMERTLPIYKGEIPGTCLGCNMEIVDDKGNPVDGELGRLVLSTPMPNLPLGIFGDSDGSVFKEKYFSRYPGKFDTGDVGIRNPITKGWIIYGRSDHFMKQGEVSIGSTELCKIMDNFPEVGGSLCLPKYHTDGSESAVLFLKMRSNHIFNDEFVQTVRETIAGQLSSSCVPDYILEAPDIPYNMNGKKMETLVKNIINNKEYNTEELRNIECLSFFQNLPELQNS